MSLDILTYSPRRRGSYSAALMRLLYSASDPGMDREPCAYSLGRMVTGIARTVKWGKMGASEMPETV